MAQPAAFNLKTAFTLDTTASMSSIVNSKLARICLLNQAIQGPTSCTGPLPKSSNQAGPTPMATGSGVLPIIEHRLLRDAKCVQEIEWMQAAIVQELNDRGLYKTPLLNSGILNLK